MACPGYDDVLDLPDHALAELRDVRGATLRVTRGTLWVTQDHDPRDVVLRAGDVWTVERNGLTLAEAQGDATFCIVGGVARRVHATPSTTSWLAGLAAPIAAFARAHGSRRFVPYL